jgi:hypothetical protein
VLVNIVINLAIYNCQKIDYSNIYSNENSNSSYVFKMDCGNDYSISDITLFGSTDQKNKKLVNEIICRDFMSSIDLLLDCSYYEYVKQEFDKNNCGQKQTCLIRIENEKMKQKCNSDRLWNVYASYSCYGNKIQ